MTNKQYLVHEIKQTLHRDDLTNFERMRLLGLLARFVPVPVKRRKPKAVKPSPVQNAAVPETVRFAGTGAKTEANKGPPNTVTMGTTCSVSADNRPACE